MNNTPNSGGRKKKTGQGNGAFGKRKPAQTGGPVGREDGYSGREEGANQQPQGDNGDKGALGDIAGSLIGGMLSGSGNSGSSNNTSNQSSSSGLGGGLLGSLLGGGSSSGGRKSGLGKLLPIILIALVLLFLFKGKKCDLSSLLGGMTSGGDTSGFMTFDNDSSFNTVNTYDQADLSAPAAVSSSTSVATPNLTIDSSARDKYTKLRGNGNDEVTIMVYMCGTDLESKYGMATNDLNEMLKAQLNDDKVNIIVETGGTKTWKNNVISNSTNQIWRVTSRGMQALEKDLGKKAMTDNKTLTEFIKYCASNYPADRYMLIFWDHGGGSLSGYGYDQNFNGSMTLDKINRALYDGGVKFDFIGFDACLMATLENAVVIDQYADYLIASEETEPGCGWYYTKWLTELSKNTSINTVTLAKTIIDDFNDVCKKNNAGDSTTLSIVDLAEFHSTVPRAFGDFATSVSGLLDTKKYDVVANARRSAREFGASAGINHVDLIHLANGVGTSEAQSLIKALQGCIKYNRTSKSMTNAYGMSIYFPYTSFSSVNSAVSLYNAIGVDPQYSACIKSFASLAAGGQIATGSTSSPLGSLFGDLSGTTSSSSSSDVLGGLLGSFLGGGSSGGSGDIAGSLIGSILGGRSIGDNDWFDAQKVLDNADYYDAHAIYADDMMTTVKGDKTVLSLSKEKWEMVQNVQLNVFVDDGEGYIDLGMDNVYEFDSDGDLLIDYDRTWIALDGQIVPYYMISNVTDGDDYVITGRVPAYLNGDHDHLVYVIIVFDNETEDNEYGYVAGVRYNYKDETDTLGRGLIALKEGDKLEFVCDFYGYDKTYQASYFFGDPLTIGKQMPEVTNVPIPDDLTALVSYCLTDIYDNEFWTMSKKF